VLGRRRSPWTLAQHKTLVAMSIANVAVALDFAGLNVALPQIGVDFDASTASLESITLAYLLTLTVFLVPAGRFADLRGRRRTWVAGLVIFAAGSVASAAAQSSFQLVLARGATGIGAAIVTATMLSLMATTFVSPVDRGRAVGAWSAIGAIGVAIGPLVGGTVTGVASWRWFFVLGVALAIGALVVGGRSVSESTDETGEPVDWAGAVLLVVALTAFVLALHYLPIGSDTVVAVVLAAGAVLGAGLFVRRERRSPSPLVDPSHLQAPGFRLSCAVAFLANVAFAAVMFFLALYLQDVYGLGPGGAGATFLALTVSLAVLSPIAGRGSARWGASIVMAVGMTILTASFLVFALIDAGTGLAIVVVGLLLSGGGQAFAFNGSNLGAIASVASADLGVASGVVNGMRQAGSLIGLAVTGAIFRFVGGEDPGPVRFLDALPPTMLFVAGVCAVGAVLAFVARRHEGVRADP
jgi:MFS family permease